MAVGVEEAMSGPTHHPPVPLLPRASLPGRDVRSLLQVSLEGEGAGPKGRCFSPLNLEAAALKESGGCGPCMPIRKPLWARVIYAQARPQAARPLVQGMLRTTARLCPPHCTPAPLCCGPPADP